MPGFGTEKGGSLSASDIAAVVAYVKSLAGLETVASAGVSVTAPSTTPAVAAPATASPAPLARSPDDEALAARGKELYQQNCASCHGETVERMGRLASKEWLQQRGSTAIARIIARGVSLPGARDAMPGFAKEQGGALSGEDIGTMVVYLRSLAGLPPHEPPAATGPVDSAQLALGKELYAKGCAMCHGDGGDKLRAANLADTGWVTKLGDQGLTAGIADGKGTMPGFGTEKGGSLSASDIAAVVAYVKSLAGL
jgi:mono/diheme cytochrome c family protein